MSELVYCLDPVPTFPSEGCAVDTSAEGANEYLPVLDENGLVIGRALRPYVHSGSKLLHPVVHLHVINRMGEIYLQKRAEDKFICPGMWDTAVGGHIGYGELVQEALYREAAEELNFYNFNPQLILEHIFESEVDREWIFVFAAVGNFEIDPHNAEVQEGRYWSMNEIKKNIGKGVFTPEFEWEFSKIRSKLEALL